MRVSALEKTLLTELKALPKEPWRARVSVKYRHGLDILIDGIGHPVFVSTAAKGLFPSHMVVSSKTLETLLDKPVESPLFLSCAPLPAHSPGTCLVIANRSFDLHLALGLSRDIDHAWLERRLEQYRRLLSLIASSGGLGAIEGIFDATWCHRAAFDVQAPNLLAIESLLGCGVGSTPAGDDMLVGAASVCHTLSGVSGNMGYCAKKWLATLHACQPVFKKRTTLMSCGYLNAALDGQFGSHLVGLHKAFFGLSPKSLLHAMMLVKKHGSTSGVDALVGVYLGYRMFATHQ